jgi:WD40 repeat protein
MTLQLPLLRTLGRHQGGVHCAAFEPSGHVAITAGADESINWWDSLPLPVRVLKRAHSHTITSAAITRDGRKLITGSYDKRCVAWHFESCAKLWVASIEEDSHPIVGVCTAGSRDATVVTCDMAGVVKFLDIENGFLLRALRLDCVGYALSFAVWGSTVVVAGGLKLGDIRDRADAARGALYASHLDETKEGVLTPGPIQSLLLPLCEGRGAVMAVAISSSPTPVAGRTVSQSLAVAFEADPVDTGRMRGSLLLLYDGATMEVRRRLDGHRMTVCSVAWLPEDGGNRWLISGSIDRTLRLWHTPSGGCVLQVGHNSPLSCVSASPRLDRLITGCEDGSCRLWQLRWEVIKPSFFATRWAVLDVKFLWERGRARLIEGAHPLGSLLERSYEIADEIPRAGGLFQLIMSYVPGSCSCAPL